MQNKVQKRKLTGIGLIVVGFLFLMVSNGILLGWDNVWPAFLAVAGILLLRTYGQNKTSELLFSGLMLLPMGVFLLLFSLGLLSWNQMDVLWPVIPAVAGIGLLAVGTRHHANAALIVGVVIVLFAFLGFLREGGVINERIVAPFIRLWPLVLVIAGVTLLRTRTAGGEDQDMKAVRGVMAEEGGEGVADDGDAGAVAER